MSSLVAYKNIEDETKEGIFSRIEEVLNLANWKSCVTGKNVFLKINLMSNQVVPGQCTSPWVVEGLVKILLSNNYEVKIGDADVATQRQVEDSARKWGILDICKRYGVPFVNLSKEKTESVRTGGNILREVDVPKILLYADSIITVPVLKTHNVTKMTCALKHQWSCIPRFRHQYHDRTDYVIPEINKAVNINFALVDATVCMEGNGPRVGKPKIVNALFASNDLVAIDAFAADFIGLNYKEIGYIVNAEKIGLGRIDYKVIGDNVKKIKFEPARIEQHPIVYLEMKLRKIPGLRHLLFNTPLFKIPAWIASKYNSVWYYNLKGKKYAREIVNNYNLYKNEFGNLIK